LSTIDPCASHFLYHIDRCNTAIAHLVGKLPRSICEDLMRASHDLMICAVDTQYVAREIIDIAKAEETILGAKVHTWRAAARALYEIGSVGPCLQGDHDLARNPVRSIASKLLEKAAS
jgi:hypothetical protein